MTQALQQHAAGKRQFPGMLVLVRVGDFFHTYGDDAEAYAAVTGKNPVFHGDQAMIGFPSGQLRSALALLWRAHYQVAICDLTS